MAKYRISTRRRHCDSDVVVLVLRYFSLVFFPLSTWFAQQTLNYPFNLYCARYYKNDSAMEEDEGPSYTLTFTLTFPHSGDTVYLAHCYPYRYSDLTEDLLNIQSSPERYIRLFGVM